MLAGNRDRRISIERFVATENDLGEEIKTWSEIVVGGIWAQVRAVSDGERWKAGEISAQKTSRFVILFSAAPDVGPKDRIQYDGGTYNILAVKELGHREGLEITAATRTD